MIAGRFDHGGKDQTNEKKLGLSLAIFGVNLNFPF